MRAPIRITDAELRAATRELQPDIEAEHASPGCLDDLFAHYAPFGLDE